MIMEEFDQFMSTEKTDEDIENYLWRIKHIMYITRILCDVSVPVESNLLNAPNDCAEDEWSLSDAAESDQTENGESIRPISQKFFVNNLSSI